MIEGFLLYFLGFSNFKGMDSYGYSFDFWSVGTVIYTCIVLIANIKILINTNTHTIFSATITILTILSYFGTVVVMSYIPRFTIFGNDKMVLGDKRAFLSVLQIVTLVILCDFFINKISIFLGIVKEGDKLPPYKIETIKDIAFGNVEEEHSEADNPAFTEEQEMKLQIALYDSS